MYINNTYFNRTLQNNTEKIYEYTRQLSTGKRINSASNDASGLQISTRMTAQNKGNSQAIRNIQDGISLLQTADGSLSTIQDMLQRLRELSVQGKNGTYNAQQKSNIEKEMKEIIDGIDGIAKTNTFNGIPLLTDGKSSVLNGVPLDDQRVKIENIPVDTTLGAKTTVEFWMLWEGSSVGSPMVIGWDDRYNLQLTGRNIGINTATTNIIGAPSDNLRDKWSHIAVTFANGVIDENSVSLYINGQKQDLSDMRVGTGVSRTVTSTIYIGGWGIDPTHDFGGRVDELKIWNGERTEQQVRNDMNEILQGDEEHLLGYWRLNDGSVEDESINGNDGQLLNGSLIGEGVTEPVKIHTGNTSGNDDWLGLPSISKEMLDLNDIDLNDVELLNKIDNAIDIISEQRGYIGAKINQYDFKISNLENTITNTEAAQMRIEDLDMASAMSNLTKTEIQMNITQQMLKINHTQYDQKMKMLFN